MNATYSAWHAFLWSECLEPGTRLSNDLLDRIRVDWLTFREQAEAMGFDAVEHRAIAIDPIEGDEWDYAAHDFILTRNRHGAGFWDGGWHEPWGARLSKLAHTFPELETYVDDNDTLRLY